MIFLAILGLNMNTLEARRRKKIVTQKTAASIPPIRLSADLSPTNVEFVIFVPSFNNEKYAEENLASICWQKSSKPYQVICVDDGSTDKTGQVMEQYVKKHHLESKVTIIHNKENMGGMANHYNVIHTLPDHKVVVAVDGDDKLTENNVLLRLEQEYRDPSVWMTYGSGWIIPDNKELISEPLDPELFLKKRLRKEINKAKSLRTFKAGLFKKIKKSDLMYENEFYPVTWDLAIMYPMLEMCSPKTDAAKPHYRLIKDILYIYRMNTPINDFRIRRALQHKMGEHIQARPPYTPIHTL